MKLSEAVELIWNTSCRVVASKDDVKAALLKIWPGQAWDPEEPLPERLELQHLEWMGGNSGFFPNPVRGEGQAPTRGFSEHEALEVIRRYSLVPELRKRITAHLLGGAEGGNCVQFTEKLLALIDNKEPT